MARTKVARSVEVDECRWTSLVSNEAHNSLVHIQESKRRAAWRGSRVLYHPAPFDIRYLMILCHEAGIIMKAVFCE